MKYNKILLKFQNILQQKKIQFMFTLKILQYSEKTLFVANKLSFNNVNISGKTLNKIAKKIIFKCISQAKIYKGKFT